MSEVVVHQPQSQAISLDEQMQYSKALAAASIIPKAYQNQPANILVAIGYAQALGESPIAALTDVYVVEGRPSMSASMMHRRALEAGHRVRVTSTDTEATVSIWRRDDPQYEHKVTWTLDRAKHAGLMGRKGPWQTYPAAMLRSRAVSEACRMACPEVLGAVKYTPEEIGGEFTDAPEAAASKPSGPTTKVSRKRKESEPDPEPEEPTSTEDPGAGDNPRPAAEQAPAHTPPTQAQFRALYAVMGDDGVNTKDKSEIYAWLGQAVGREITSGNDLSKDEASRIIDEAQATATGQEPA